MKAQRVEWKGELQMQYITDVREAKEIDRMTIQEIGIPSMVLMEKAALAVAGCVKSNSAIRCLAVFLHIDYLRKRKR